MELRAIFIYLAATAVLIVTFAGFLQSNNRLNIVIGLSDSVNLLEHTIQLGVREVIPGKIIGDEYVIDLSSKEVNIQDSRRSMVFDRMEIREVPTVYLAVEDEVKEFEVEGLYELYVSYSNNSINYEEVYVLHEGGF